MLYAVGRDDDFFVLLIVAASLVAVVSLAVIFLLLSFRKRNPHRSSQRRIRIPAMQEVVKPRREKNEAFSEAEKAAVIAAVLAICTEGRSVASLRVVSFRRIR